MLSAHTATPAHGGSNQAQIAEATADMRHSMAKINHTPKRSKAVQRATQGGDPQVRSEDRTRNSRNSWAVTLCFKYVLWPLPQVHGLFRIPVPLASFFPGSGGDQRAY